MLGKSTSNKIRWRFPLAKQEDLERKLQQTTDSVKISASWVSAKPKLSKKSNYGILLQYTFFNFFNIHVNSIYQELYSRGVATKADVMDNYTVPDPNPKPLWHLPILFSTPDNFDVIGLPNYLRRTKKNVTQGGRRRFKWHILTLE